MIFRSTFRIAVKVYRFLCICMFSLIRTQCQCRMNIFIVFWKSKIQNKSGKIYIYCTFYHFLKCRFIVVLIFWLRFQVNWGKKSWILRIINTYNNKINYFIILNILYGLWYGCQKLWNSSIDKIYFANKCKVSASIDFIFETDLVLTALVFRIW